MNDPDNTMNAALKEVKCIQKAEFQLHDFLLWNIRVHPG